MPDQSFHKLVLPVLSENTRSATVVKVLAREGDRVEKGQPIFEMVSDKAEFDFESSAAGTLGKLFVTTNSEVPTGFILALIAENAGREIPGELLRECETGNERILREFRNELDISGIWRDSEPGPSGGMVHQAERIRATPAARRLAREKGLDLADIKSVLSIDGIIREEDVRRYLDQQAQSGP